VIQDLERLQDRVKARSGLPSHEKRAELRRSVGLSAREIGLVVGVTGQTVRNWESGSEPRPDLVERYADVLDAIRREVGDAGEPD